MTTRFTLNIEWIEKQLIKDALPVMRKATDDLMFQVKLLSPVDTGKYLSSHRNLWVIQEWNKLKWAVWNIDDKAEKVEFWWRKTPVNWNRKIKWDIYTNVWANTYQLALEKVKRDFINNIKRWL